MPKTDKQTVASERYTNTLLKGAELEAARAEANRLYAMLTADRSVDLITGHNIFVEVMSATINDGRIEIAVQVYGQVQRPGIIAEARGGVQHLVVNANIIREDGS